MNNKMGGHSHGGARGFEEMTHEDNTAVTLPPPRPTRDSSLSSFEVPEASSSVTEEGLRSESKEEIMVKETQVEDLESQVDPLVYRKMNSKLFQSLLL